MGSDIIKTIAVMLMCRLSHINVKHIISHDTLRLCALSLLCFVVLSFATPSDSYALFEELTDKGVEIFTGMREIIYVVAGFGIIGIAVGGFFGNLNWKWLGAVIIGLVIIAVTAAFINYVAGEDVVDVQDTLK